LSNCRSRPDNEEFETHTLSAVFFLAPQGALEGAPVDGETKPPPNLGEQGRDGERGVVGP
jgi:hypothetical protein